MKPRRFVSATTFSISCSRLTVTLARYSPPGEPAARAGRPPHVVGRRVCKLLTPHPARPLRGRADLPTAWGGESFASSLLEDGEDVAGRVLEPGYVRASTCR